MNVVTRHVAVAVLVVAAAVGSVSVAAPFDPLFQLGRITGTCLVRKPGVADFEAGVEGRAYPFGSLLQTQAESETVVYLSSAVQVGVGASTSVTVANEAADATGTAKQLTLESGMLAMYLPNDDEKTTWPLTVVTPVATFDNFKGRSKLRLQREAEAHVLTLVTEMGDLRVKGPQFAVQKMRRSSSLEICTAIDESYTGLTGKSGEYEVTIERGIDEPVVTGFRSGARIKIWRRRATLSDRLAVSVMIAGAEGGVQTSFAYLQGESAIIEAVKEGDAAAEVAPVAAGVPAAAVPDTLFGEPAAKDAGESAAVEPPAEAGAVPAAKATEDVWNF